MADASADVADAAAGTADAAAGTADAAPAPTCATDCSELAGLCVLGVCNEDTDTCEALTAGDGTACDDGNPCRESATCTDGGCGGGTLICDVPTALTSGDAIASAMAGPAPQIRDSSCEPGEVLVGLYGSHVPSTNPLFEWFQSAGAICAPLEWTWDPASARYQTRHGTTSNLSEIGNHSPFADWHRQCADGEVIVGVNAIEYSGQALTRMEFECAPLTAIYTAGQWSLEVGPATLLMQVGRGVGSLVHSDCAAGQIATGTRMGTNAAGTSATGISFLCAEPALVVGQ